MRHCVNRRIRRKSVESCLLRSLICHKKARTTVERAKKIRPVFERLVTKAASVNDSNRVQITRLLASELSSWDLAAEMVAVIGPMVGKRPGGYTSIAKLCKPRNGDAAREAVIYLVDHDRYKKVEAYKPTETKSTKVESVENVESEA